MLFTMEFVVYFVKTTETGMCAKVAQQQKIISKRFIINHCANQGVDEGERLGGSRVWPRPVWSGLQSLVKPSFTAHDVGTSSSRLAKFTRK
jgi:hypothetical protein